MIFQIENAGPGAVPPVAYRRMKTKTKARDRATPRPAKTAYTVLRQIVQWIPEGPDLQKTPSGRPGGDLAGGRREAPRQSGATRGLARGLARGSGVGLSVASQWGAYSSGLKRC